MKNKKIYGLIEIDLCLDKKGDIMVLCPNCNNENQDGAKFCGKCGTELNQIHIEEENNNLTQNTSLNEEKINEQNLIIEKNKSIIHEQEETINNNKNLIEKQNKTSLEEKVNNNQEKENLIEKIKLRLLYKNYHKNLEKKEYSKSKIIGLIISLLWILIMYFALDSIWATLIFGGIIAIGLGTTSYIIGLFIRYFTNQI